MKVLIPLLSRHENSPGFLEKAVDGASQVVLLLIVDTKGMPGQFGFATTEIRQGNILMEDLKAKLREKRKPFNDIIEWGDTLTKIDHIAKLNKVDKIIMQKQENKFFNDIVKELEKQGVEIEII